MDHQTLSAYETNAAAYAAEWEDEQDVPHDLYELLRTFFTPGTAADVGCGSGRDTAWLVRHGFDAVGYDASEGLLAEARRRHPEITFAVATLPDLAELGARTFDNVLSETVIMHLPPADVPAATRRLASLLNPGGTLYLSWRTTPDHDARDAKGRLYAAFPAALVRRELTGAEILHDAEIRSVSSNKIVHRIIARRIP
ncbi:class I SAM-dependent methyltransferase [Cryptosporangium japonicum]|uniref:Class I SAM-dependent methyltransferase n=1 Tax=Cryptosporangium japonicum TaxID=80872 RepID=A0ABN0UE60_9ACTN